MSSTRAITLKGPRPDPEWQPECDPQRHHNARAQVSTGEPWIQGRESDNGDVGKYCIPSYKAQRDYSSVSLGLFLCPELQFMNRIYDRFYMFIRSHTTKEMADGE